MIDPVFERRVIAWAVSCREGKRKLKCATEVFCEALPYLYGTAEAMLDDNGEPLFVAPKETQPDRIKIDQKDADLLSVAYRDPRLTKVMRNMLRFRYCYGMSPKRVEECCHLPRKSFSTNIEIALGVFQKIVRDKEERLDG